jgi:hypothetical protein
VIGQSTLCGLAEAFERQVERAGQVTAGEVCEPCRRAASSATLISVMAGTGTDVEMASSDMGLIP